MIRELTLRSIRAYDEASVELSDGMSVFLGPNGNGKTTILEAAYLLGTARSFRTAKLRELIREGAESGVVEGRVGEPSHTLQVEIEPSRRRLLRDGREISGMPQFVREMTMVALAPEHQQIVLGAGDERRRYLDFTLFTLNPEYLTIAQQYRKAVRQKQALLRSELPLSMYEDQVSPWDEKIAEHGEDIRFRRRKLTRELQPAVLRFFDHLTSGEGEPEISYTESPEPLGEELKAKRRAEHAARRALFGPHRDDLKIQLNRQPAHAVASQGEKSSLLLSLKLAELEIVERARGEGAVLILDDIGVTLDHKRRKRLFEQLAESQHQALVSTPEEEIAEVARASGGRVLTRVEERSPRGFSVARWGAA